MKVKEAIQRLAGFNLEAELLLEKSEKVILFTKEVGSPWETKNVYIVTTKEKEKPKTLVSKWYWVYWDNYHKCYTTTGKYFSETEIETFLKEINGTKPERIHSSHITKYEEAKN